MSWLLMLVLTGQTSYKSLGDDDYNRREATHKKLDSFLCVLLLPSTDPNPEINHRLRQLHSKHDRWVSPIYYERLIQRDNYWKWFDQYVINGESLIETKRDTFSWIRQEGKYSRIDAFKERYPLNVGDNQRWLQGVVFPEGYDIFLDHIRGYKKKVKANVSIGGGLAYFIP